MLKTKAKQTTKTTLVFTLVLQSFCIRGVVSFPVQERRLFAFCLLEEVDWLIMLLRRVTIHRGQLSPPAPSTIPRDHSTAWYAG